MTKFAQNWHYERNLSNSVVLSQISVLISEYLEVLGHFLAQPDRIQQKMTKGSKKTRWNSRIWRHLAQILTFCMEIEPKTLFCFEFRYLPAFVLIVFVIFVLSLIGYNKKWARVSKELGQRVQIRGIWPKFGRFVWKLTQKRCFVANFGTCRCFCWLSLSFLCSGW